MLEGLAHPRELFLANQCEERKLETIVAKVKVHDGPFNNPMKEFFCWYVNFCLHICPPILIIARYMFDKGSGTFTFIDSELLTNLRSLLPRDNCASCQVMAA